MPSLWWIQQNIQCLGPRILEHPLIRGQPTGLLAHCWLSICPSPPLLTQSCHHPWPYHLHLHTAILSQAFSRIKSFCDISKSRSFLKSPLPNIKLFFLYRFFFPFPWQLDHFYISLTDLMNESREEMHYITFISFLSEVYIKKPSNTSRGRSLMDGLKKTEV